VRTNNTYASQVYLPAVQFQGCVWRSTYVCFFVGACFIA